MAAAPDLASYQTQLAQVDAALALAPDDEELLKLREDLAELVKTLNDLAKVEQAKPGPDALFRVGEKVLALSREKDGWHPAKVERVTEKGYDLAFSGLLRGTKDMVAKLAVKAYEKPDVSALAPGQTVSAWYADDGAFYAATVQGVGTDTVEVEYAGFEGSTETLEAECVRPDNGESAARAAAAGSRSGPSRPRAAAGAADADGQGGAKKRPFQVPQSLEIKPDDTPEVVERKKRKLKAISRKAAAAEKDEAINEQRSSWQSFMTKKKDFGKLTRNNHDPRYDPERDHMEMARRWQSRQSGDRE